MPAPNSPAEALDRITIAPEAIARIAEALTTGGSIVVSDHGINQGGETGEGTDFIVPCGKFTFARFLNANRYPLENAMDPITAC